MNYNRKSEFSLTNMKEFRKMNSNFLNLNYLHSFKDNLKYKIFSELVDPAYFFAIMRFPFKRQDSFLYFEKPF